MSLEFLLSGVSSGAGRAREPEKPESPPEVLCATLRETLASFSAGCPFKPGDLVTPRANSDLRGAGRPQIVLEVLATPVRNFHVVEDQNDVASAAFGSRIDVRIARESHGEIVANWTESWKLEPYYGPGSEPAQQAA